EAVNLGYIEPLVISGGSKSGNYFFENSYATLSGGSSGAGYCPSLVILIKPKNYKLINVSFDSNGDYTYAQAQLAVSEFINFDISLTPNNS
ncbi:MAG: hypothetical protein PHE54_04280, partial [Bacilli bacterium]|nr:hypothetical protein [Bacilli bacterium]